MGPVRTTQEVIWYWLAGMCSFVEALTQQQLIAFFTIQRRQVDCLYFRPILVKKIEIWWCSRFTVKLHIMKKWKVIKDERPHLRKPVQSSSTATLHYTFHDVLIGNFYHRLVIFLAKPKGHHR